MVELKKLDSKLGGFNTQIAVLSVDSPEQSQSMKEDLSLPFDFLCDQGKKVIKQYHLFNPDEQEGIAFPAMFLIDGQGIIRYRSLEKTKQRVDLRELNEFLEQFQKNPDYQLEGKAMRDVGLSLKSMEQLAYNMILRGNRENWKHYKNYPFAIGKKIIKKLNS